MTTTADTQVDLSAPFATLAAREIRTMASVIIHRVDLRANHPTYGVTKTSLRQDLERLNGMVALYAVVTGQANFIQAPDAAEPAFALADDARYVARARALVEAL